MKASSRSGFYVAFVLATATGWIGCCMGFVAPPLSGTPFWTRSSRSLVHRCKPSLRSFSLRRHGLMLRMCEKKDEADDNHGLVQKAFRTLESFGSAFTKPVEVSPAAIVGGLVAGSFSLTICIFVALFTITIGPVVEDPPLTAQEQAAAEQKLTAVDEKTYLFHEILNDVSAAYVDDVEPNKLFETGIRAMLGSLDPYTEFENNKDAENLQIMTFGRYGGVGLSIGTDSKYEKGKGLVKDDSRVLVIGSMEGYAWDSGLRAGDHILEVADESVKGKDLSTVTTMLRGEPGTTVDVAYVRDGTDGVQHALLKRKSIKIKDVPLAMMVGSKEDKVGYMLLKGFAMETAREVRQAISKLRDQTPDGKLNGLIIDMRGNPGGLLTSAVDVAELFLPEGSTIVSTKGRTGRNLEYISNRRQFVGPETKVVVLTNGATASAAEIVSGAVQDHDRGIILGERTFGKGLVQQVVRLPFDTSLKLTVAKYYTPSGRCIQSVEYKNGDSDELRSEDGKMKQFKFGDARTSAFKARKYEDKEKKSFITDHGRIVRDGGGIEPDLYFAAERLSELELALLEQNAYLEFTSEWAKTHPLDDKMMWRDQAIVTDEMFAEFERFVGAHDIVVKTRFDAALDELKEAFKESKLSGLEAAAAELKAKAKQELLARFPAEKASISKSLEDAFRARVEPESVRLAHALQYDKCIAQAVKVASGREDGPASEYQRLLAKGREIRTPALEGVTTAANVSP